MRLLLEPVRLLMILPPIVGLEVVDALMCLWFDVGLGEREIFRSRFVFEITSSERLDCSDTPLSHVSYSASDCDDGDGQGESSCMIISASFVENSGGGGVTSFSSS